MKTAEEAAQDVLMVSCGGALMEKVPDVLVPDYEKAGWTVWNKG